jgi:hypothetical protein
MNIDIADGSDTGVWIKRTREGKTFQIDHRHTGFGNNLRPPALNATIEPVDQKALFDGVGLQE